jgi:serine phosphatase RsbU (regulator of sigma subunit)
VRGEAKAEQEMKLAAEVQQALLPAASGQSRYVLAGLSIPSRAIGGDFFDHFELEGDRLGFVIADVAGKGPAAALLAAAAQGMIRMACSPDSPSATFHRVNAALPQHSGRSRFVTAFHGVLSPDGRLLFSNAGHLPGLLRRTSGEVLRLDANGLMLGPFPEAVFEENEVRLGPGDEVVVFSDGVSEATSTNGQYFGMERAVEVITASPHLPAAELVTRLVAAVQGFAKGRALEDDLTVLVVRYEG